MTWSDEDVLEVGSRRPAIAIRRGAAAVVIGLAAAVSAVVVAARPPVVSGTGSLAVAPGHTSTRPTPSPVHGHYLEP